MARIKFAKVKRTDYRPAPAGPDPLDRTAALLVAEKGPHDKAAETLSDHAVLAAAADLGRRHYHNSRDPEHRWGMARYAALARQIYARHLCHQ